MIDKISQRSADLFASGFFCAESVLLAIAESKNIQSDLIPRIATGFCGGLSRTGGICGAVSGAIMAINLIFGRNSPKESAEANYAAVKKLLATFEDEFASTNCMTLIGCDLDTREGQKFFKKHKLIEQCKVFSKEATRIAVSIIEDRR